MKILMSIINFLKGKKTYFVAFCGLVYAIYTQNMELAIAILPMIGIRLGMDKI